MTIWLNVAGALRAVAFSVGTMTAQAVPSTPMQPQRSMPISSASGIVSNFPTVKGLPYGTTRTRLAGVSRSMRDSEGRMRVETGRMVEGMFEADSVTVTDPGAQTQTMLYTKSRSAEVSHNPPRLQRTPKEEYAAAERKAKTDDAMRERWASMPNHEQLDLGIRQVAGVNAQGTRYTTVIPAGTQGKNKKDIRIVIERWWSPELKIPLDSTVDDPMAWKTVTTMTELERADPDASLFRVPEGYTVTERGNP